MTVDRHSRRSAAISAPGNAVGHAEGWFEDRERFSASWFPSLAEEGVTVEQPFIERGVFPALRRITDLTPQKREATKRPAIEAAKRPRDRSDGATRRPGDEASEAAGFVDVSGGREPAAEVESREEHLHERSDQEGEGEGADPHRPSQQPAGGEGRALDHRSGEPE